MINGRQALPMLPAQQKSLRRNSTGPVFFHGFSQRFALRQDFLANLVDVR